MAFTSDTLPPRKDMALTVATKEMLESSDPAAEAVFRAELMAAVVAALDTAFIDPANSGIVEMTPGAITSGLSPVSGTASFAADLKGMLANFTGDLRACESLPTPSAMPESSGAG